MTEISETTEKIIRQLAKKVVPPNVRDFAKEIGISLKELNEQLALLEVYYVAKFHHSPLKNTVQKMEKFGEVVQAGGLIKSLKSKEKTVKSDFKRLKILVANGELKEVISILHDRIEDNKHINYLILQSARYYDIERAINMNTVQWDNANIEKNRIRNSVLELIDEVEANEKEEQKYLTDEDERKFGIKVEYQEPIEIDIAPKISSSDWEAEGLILRFLKVHNQWYFSPLRINKCGARQIGFGDLSKYTSKRIKSILEKLLIEGKVKKTMSKKGNPIYKIKE